MPIFPLISQPGIKRDGTLTEGNNYVDGQWCRFYRGLPKKIGGYRELNNQFSGIQRGSYIFSVNGTNNIIAGSSATLEKIDLYNDSSASAIITLTPSGFTPQNDYVWQFDSMFDAGGSKDAVLAHAGRNLVNIDNNIATPIYYGDPTSSAAFATTGKSVSGGVCVLPPYAIAYGDSGYIEWSVENKPTDWTGTGSGNARITSKKIVKGMVCRGSGQSPSGLFWSLDSLVRLSYTGGATIFRADTISSDISILSSSSVVEYDGLYYWVAADRFLVYNGVVQEIANPINKDWFFSNLNKSQRQKVWGMKVPEWGEIWWFFPKGNSTECNHAIIYNVREGSWYDTELSRSSGYYNYVFPYPIMFGTELNAVSKTQLFQHEFGVDAIINSQALAIPSYFETADLSFSATDPTGIFKGKQKNILLTRFEPDFVQTGNIDITVKGRPYATQPDITYDFIFTPTTDKIDMKIQHRYMRMKFSSNCQNGNYVFGQNLITIDEGDDRPV